ncbi:hypothetical protein ACFFMN_06520 [Planobispora siamensis]|uniref:Integrase catalytic domain-containing protein n=1 Tax=Planobispora siamensis TaxID=936338 RepID=A0A8J3WSI5_9ACTN|nr:hypothetical protein [Planobispora siamensis]GIH97951.1 hypothetical protein Psi01_85810 [Planobispora siamensis]
MKRYRSCRRELLDRYLLWNERHLRHALREYERFYNEHRAHQALAQAAPLRAVPDPITDPAWITELSVRRRDRLGGVLREYSHAACELHGWSFRQAQADEGELTAAMHAGTRQPQKRPDIVRAFFADPRLAYITG